MGSEMCIRDRAKTTQILPTVFAQAMPIIPTIKSMVHVIIVVVVARLSHAIALMANSGVTAGRLIGTLGTVIPTVVTAGYLILLAVGKL